MQERVFVRVSLVAQSMVLVGHEGLVRQFQVSTSRFGAGAHLGSQCTPCGKHVVRAKIGAGAESGMVFIARRPSGEKLTPSLYAKAPDRDWILTRILWLSGCEPGRNRLGTIDTMRRYIYIHGCPDQEPVGIPLSHGCIRMRNADVIELFDFLDVGSPVFIQEHPF